MAEARLRPGTPQRSPGPRTQEGLARPLGLGRRVRAGGRVDPRTEIDDRREVDIAIVGAGFAGLGMGIQLGRRGRESFVILERADRVGGTWRDNRYPGVACDIPSHLYSFSFLQKLDWSEVFASGAEIESYLESCVEHENLSPHLRLRTEMTRAIYDEGERAWWISTTAGEYRARTDRKSVV